VAERTEAMATPACLTPATNMTELTEVIAPRIAIRIFTARPLLANAPGTERAHGVSQSTSAATGNRIACAVVALISESGGLTSTVATAQASEADRKSTRLNSSHVSISYAVFCLKKKKTKP